MRVKPNGILNEYLRLKESGSPSDFPNVCLDAQHKLLLKAFRGVEGSWRTLAKKGDLADFKPHNRVWLGEAQDLLKRAPGGPYKSTPMSDYKYAIQLETFGRTFNLLRETVINDDLNAFQEAPAKLGRAAARTAAKIFTKILETNAICYDGTALFTSGHANQSSTALTADTAGISALQAATLAIYNAKDPGTNEKMGLQAKYLLVPAELAEIATWLLSAQSLVGGLTGIPSSNPLQQPKLSPKLTLVVDPFLTQFTGRWYVLADPEQAPAVEMGFLDGKTEPDLLMKDPGVIRIGGGADQWGYEYDDIEYKVRYDVTGVAAMYQGIYKGGA